MQKIILLFVMMFLSSSTVASVKQGTMVLAKNSLRAVGKAHYTIDSRGQLTVRGKAKSWLVGTYRFDDSYEVDPTSLLSERYMILHESIAFDGLTLRVVEVNADEGFAKAKGLSKNGWVTFQFDIKGTIVDLMAVHFEASMMPIRLNLKKVS
ncbi:hypothetical protein [Pseudobacteriovorax antillogorgiicola]|uniref:Uncharacterized protein n=1 Tax=Pseudobacteriovorax antillogorgiicola TaxID=1513793 RepID=A0A1Y6CH80_9BACT|nr:hypothetical protein [Pseudobacteriovorax antillogorgiicola]TCS46922.1 hypothetical protein EDD56_12217 [Pseudobacteriovorax antillogorgiicola]SMF64229.1 hypothetical protein SAMN06296036_12217 [Pseudobacteriovorax antillogorgiicola]